MLSKWYKLSTVGILQFQIFFPVLLSSFTRIMLLFCVIRKCYILSYTVNMVPPVL
jgi:hypothetical protein